MPIRYNPNIGNLDFKTFGNRTPSCLPAFAYLLRIDAMWLLKIRYLIQTQLRFIVFSILQSVPNIDKYNNHN